MLEILRAKLGEGKAGAGTGNVSIAQLLGCVLTSDTTRAAPAGLKRVLALAAEAGMGEYGEEAWGKLPLWKKTSIIAGCMNHILVLPIVEYLRREKRDLGTELRLKLEKLPGFSRAGDVGLDDLMRSCLKLFTTEGASNVYAKGDRAAFLAYMRREFPDET